MKLTDILTPERIVPHLESNEKNDVLKEIVQRGFLANGQLDGISEDDESRLVQVLLEREKLGSTALKEGLAIPHGRISGLQGLSASLAIHREGVSFDAPDQLPTRIFLTLLAPEHSGTDHLKALARISRLFSDGQLQRHIMACTTRNEIYEEIAAEDARYP